MVFPFLAAATIGAGIIGAVSSNKAANKVADASTAATRESNALQERIYNQTRSDLTPFTQAGVVAQNALQQRLGLGQPAQPVAAPANDAEFMQYDPANPGATVAGPQAPVNALAPVAQSGAEPGTYGNVNSPTYTLPTYQDPGAFTYTAEDYRQSPGYEFQLARGIDAINSSQSARGALNSGATQKGILQFAQGLAAQDFNQERSAAENTFNTTANRTRSNFDVDANRLRANFDADRNYLTQRFDTNTNALQSMATSGQNAAAQVGTAGQNYATNTGNALQTNAANVGNAALVSASNTNNLLGQGLNTLAYTQRPGVVNSLASGGAVPRANSAINQYNAYAFG